MSNFTASVRASRIKQLENAYEMIERNPAVAYLSSTKSEFVAGSLDWVETLERIYDHLGIETENGCPANVNEALRVANFMLSATESAGRYQSPGEKDEIRDIMVAHVFGFKSWRKTIAQATPRTRKTPVAREGQKEDELYQWLLSRGVHVERQVSTQSKHRIDLWLPGKFMIELKDGRVSGDDVCQAFDYYATYQKQIVLVGTGLTTAASRGIDAVNRVLDSDPIVFMTWNAIKQYLKSYLKMV